MITISCGRVAAILFLGSLELGHATAYFEKNQITSPYSIRLPMFDVDHAETDLDSGISMCRLVANLSEKHSETAMVRMSDAKQERRMELTLLRVP